MKALIQDKPSPEPTPGRVREQAEQQPHASQAGLAKRWRWYDHAAFSRDPPVNEQGVGVFKRGGAESGIKERGGGWSEKVAKKILGA